MPSSDAGFVRVSSTCRIAQSELAWQFSSSGGPGGQHANTANTRVELVFDIASSPSLAPRQRERLTRVRTPPAGAQDKTLKLWDAATGEVRMVAFMSREALALTLSTGVAHFHSRSRGKLWKKGESSGHSLAVHSVLLDCDGDCVLLLVDPAGPTCHTGSPSCFTRAAEIGRAHV